MEGFCKAYGVLGAAVGFGKTGDGLHGRRTCLQRNAGGVRAVIIGYAVAAVSSSTTCPAVMAAAR